jgi:hypothetical protein
VYFTSRPVAAAALAGAAFGIAFFFGREHAQVQHKIQNETTYTEAYSIYGDLAALKFWKWNLDSQLDLLFPIIVVSSMAFIMI